MSSEGSPSDLPDGGSVISRRRLLGVGAAGVGTALLTSACGSASTAATGVSGKSSGAWQTFYWISHGAPGDQIWVIANKGATRASSDLGVTVRVSFHSNDLASQQEAITSAIAAKATGIATSSPQPNVLESLVGQAKAANIPVVTLNSDDAKSGRVAYVGADLTVAGVTWANYLLSHGLVKSGDKVWLPVEAAGASYQVLETTGIESVFAPKGISVDVFQAGSDPAQSLQNMSDYVTAHGSSIKAVIGLGDLVMTNVPKVFKQAGWSPGKVPVVGWGNELATAQAVQQGYVNAALWQYPDSQGYQPIVLLKMIADGLGAGYDINTINLYDKSTVGDYTRFLS
jgi:simple sugar transport system substrate-binding protein